MQDLYGSHTVFVSARPARENEGFELPIVREGCVALQAMAAFLGGFTSLSLVVTVSAAAAKIYFDGPTKTATTTTTRTVTTPVFYTCTTSNINNGSRSF